MYGKGKRTKNIGKEQKDTTEEVRSSRAPSKKFQSSAPTAKTATEFRHEF